MAKYIHTPPKFYTKFKGKIIVGTTKETNSPLKLKKLTNSKRQIDQFLSLKKKLTFDSSFLNLLTFLSSNIRVEVDNCL